MIISRYTRTSRVGSTVAVFHELQPRPLYFSDADWERISLGCDHALPHEHRELVENGIFITSPEVDEKTYLEAEAKLLSKLNVPSILYLMTAESCNFSCSYCPVPEKAVKNGDNRLLREDAFAGIDLWSKHLEDHPATSPFVIFYGGEPLLNKPVIHDSVAYIRQMQQRDLLPELQLLTATNGTLLDDHFIRMCVDEDMIVVVGIDGDARMNDHLRVYADGRPTHSDIVTAIRRLVRAGVHTCASVSVTPDNVHRLHEIVPMMEDLGVASFGFNLLRGQKLVSVLRGSSVEEYQRSAAKSIVKSYEESKNKRFEFQMEKKLLAWERGEYFPPDCTCYGNQLVIRPNGNVSNCPFASDSQGHVRQLSKDFRIHKSPIVEQWRQRLPLYHEEYAKSSAKVLSGGGCAWGVDDMGGNTKQVDGGALALAEEALHAFIWSKR